MIDESKKDVNYYPIIKSEGNVIKEKMILMSVDGKEREKFLKKLNSTSFLSKNIRIFPKGVFNIIFSFHLSFNLD